MWTSRRQPLRRGVRRPALVDRLADPMAPPLAVLVAPAGYGKTTLLNVLSNFIPEEERIVTIEDSAELKLGQDHVVRLEAKPAEVDGSGRVSINDL